MDAPFRRYRRKGIGSLREVSPALVQRLVSAGLLKPTRGLRNEEHYSFEELTLLRTAAALHRAKVPLRRILLALATLRGRELSIPLTGLSISAVGTEVVVRQGSAQWTAEQGQLVLDFDGWEPGEVHDLAVPSLDERTSEEWFELGSQLEAADAGAAEHAYRQALERDGCSANAYLNLGALLCEAGRWQEAADLYTSAVARCPNEPALHFSLGVALENLDLPGKALRSYERCLNCAPDFADAHYNVARLLEILGDKQGAIRHLNAYRRALRTP